MTVRLADLSPEARRKVRAKTAGAGVEPAQGQSGHPRRRSPGTSTQRTPQILICHTCQLELVGETAAARHTATTGHNRQEVPL